MRKFPLNLPTILAQALGLTLSLGLVACDGDDGSSDTVADSTDSTGDGDGDSSGDGGECVDAPEECLRFVNCIGEIVPSQRETVESEYGVDGSCWCGSVDEINNCYATCVDQLNTAIKNNPTVSACHEKSCTLEELDPAEPYGPIIDGSCPDWNGNPQVPMEMPFGVPGGFCSPACSGIAQSCPEHNQTAADGTCYLSLGDTSYCVSRCWVDPTVIGGTQCQCGATCQPQGGPDGEGNLRGICTFE